MGRVGCNCHRAAVFVHDLAGVHDRAGVHGRAGSGVMWRIEILAWTVVAGALIATFLFLILTV